MRMKKNLWLPLVVLLLGACAGPARTPLFMNSAAWPQDMQRIALVELSFDRRYRPPPQSELVAELRWTLEKELARKGYQLIIADRGEEIYKREMRAAELLAQAPASADAVLALHVDFLALPVTMWERNPPPQAEIACEARLVSREGLELWRDRGNGLAGGTAGRPVFNRDVLRREALADLVSGLFTTLPNRR